MSWNNVFSLFLGFMDKNNYRCLFSLSQHAVSRRILKNNNSNNKIKVFDHV